MHCSMKVVYYIFTSSPGVVSMHFQTNPGSGYGNFQLLTQCPDQNILEVWPPKVGVSKAEEGI